LDDIDCAAERIEAFRDVALKVVLDRMAGPRSSGICKTCYEPIEPQRIAVNPHARHCSFCAAEEERAERQARLCGPRRA
jgi:RNA polymerase-binding transcription factor DksA